MLKTAKTKSSDSHFKRMVCIEELKIKFLNNFQLKRLKIKLNRFYMERYFWDSFYYS